METKKKKKIIELANGIKLNQTALSELTYLQSGKTIQEIDYGDFDPNYGINKNIESIRKTMNFIIDETDSLNSKKTMHLLTELRSIEESFNSLRISE